MLKRRRSLAAALVGIVLAEIFLQFWFLAKVGSDNVRDDPLLAVLASFETFVGDIRGDRTAAADDNDSTSTVAAQKSSKDYLNELAAPTSDRSIYPWGLRVCSGLGEGRILRKTQSRATDGPIEMFQVTNNCKLPSSSADRTASSPPVEVIYAHIGPTLKGGEHILDSLAITRRSNPCIAIRLLLSKSAFFGSPSVKRTCECYGISVIFIDYFENDALLNELKDVFFVSGNMGGAIKNPNFNLFTTSRMFYVRAYMKTFEVAHAFHLENDNPAYVDLARLGDAYNHCGIDIGVPMRDATSYILGFAYLKPAPLQKMIKHYIECFRERNENLTKRLNTVWINDMTLTADYAAANPGAVTVLPVNPEQTDCAAKTTNLYIDGASVSVWFHGTIHGDKPFGHRDGWGSYEGSFDPRGYEFGWKVNADHRCSGPVLRKKGVSMHNADDLRFANLHLHAKEVNRAIPACLRHQKHPFYIFGNLSSSLQEDMIADTNLSTGDVPPLPPGGPSEENTKDRRGSYPLITGDGFRSLCRNVCNRYGCNFELPQLRRGDCIMIDDNGMQNKAMPNLLALFKNTNAASYFPPFVILSHNSDHSYPKTRKLANVEFDYTDFLESNVVHHWFASNCDWRGSVEGKPKPVKLSCIPIGIENRYNKIGRDPLRYFKAMQLPLVRKGMLYVSFYRSGLKPQREEVLTYLMNIGAGREDNAPWVTYVKKGQWSWNDFAKRVREHKFVLCPHGHGLDTHRAWEVLLLGSIPVFKASTLDSMYEELPAVIVKEWNELTEGRLESEWKRIKNTEFELDKIFWPYWENIIRRKIDDARSYFEEMKAMSTSDISYLGSNLNVAVAKGALLNTGQIKPSKNAIKGVLKGQVKTV